MICIGTISQVLAYDLPPAQRGNKRGREPEVASWGWQAFLAHKERSATRDDRYTGTSTTGGASGYSYCQRFKLYLSQNPCGQIPLLPDGVSVHSAISDYLRMLGERSRHPMRWADFPGQTMKQCLP